MLIVGNQTVNEDSSVLGCNPVARLVDPDVSKERNAFILDYLTLKFNALYSFETSGTTGAKSQTSDT